MSTTGIDLIAAGIDNNLDHLHKQRWTRRAAEQAQRALHAH